MVPQEGSPQSPWTSASVVAAATICLGSAISSLLFQHVSNAAPPYFYAIAVMSPLLGFICYSTLILLCVGRGAVEPGSSTTSNNNSNNVHHHQPYCWNHRPSSMLMTTLKYCTAIGACFALSNILVDFGRSGSQAGVPDVSTVLVLLLLKLVVPVSLGLESAMDRRHPTACEISGVLILMLGVLATTLVYSNSTKSNNKTHDDEIKSNNSNQESLVKYNLKILSLCLSSFPLALGFYLVKVARQRLPLVSGVELWAILCVPEFFISVVLALLSQRHVESSGGVWDKVANLRDGIACVAFCTDTNAVDGDAINDTVHCVDACRYLWMGLPFGLAFNLAIPVLVKLKGSTAVPLFRALALPIASLIAMINASDTTIYTPFSWNAVVGVVVCTMGLLVFYGTSIIQQPCMAGYSSLVGMDGDENV